MSEIHVPLGSYTAYRLRYCTAEEMSRDAAVISLGPIPKAWLLDKKSVLLASIHRLNNTEHVHTVNGKANGFLEIDNELRGRPSNARANKHYSNDINRCDSKTDRQSNGKAKNRRRPSKSLRSKLSMLKNGGKVGDAQKVKEVRDVHHISSEQTDCLPQSNTKTSLRSMPSSQSLFPTFSGIESASNQATKYTKLENSLFQSILESEPVLEPALEPTANRINNGTETKTETVPQPQENCELDSTTEPAMSANFKEASKSYARSSQGHLYTPEMLNEDIEEAKKKLQQQRSSSGDKDQFSVSSNDSFVTANTELSNEYDTPDQNLAPTVEFLGLEKNDKEIANYNSVKVKKALSSKGSYLYSFEAKKLPLKRVDPSPCQDVDISPGAFIGDSSKHSTGTVRNRRSSVTFVNHNQEKYKRNMQKIFQIYEAGDIIKMSKVLVSVTAEYKIGRKLPNDARGERVMERWKEYLLVARSTGNLDFPMILQFYKTNRILKNDESRSADRDIAMEIEQRLEQSDSDSDFNNLQDANATDIKRKRHKKHRGRSCYFELIISQKDSRVGFHRLLDKSIKLTKEHTSIMLNYTLVMNSTNAAISWINLLKLATFQSTTDTKDTVFVKIPTLNISFTINKLSSIYRTHILNKMNKSYLLVKYNEQGYDITKLGFTEMILSSIELSLKLLYNQTNYFKNPEKEKFISFVKNNKRFLALALRKFDRLEWLVGDYETLKNQFWNILGSYYELELREFVHDEYKLEDTNIVEPIPIEGFIVKLSNRSGKIRSKFGNHYFKLLYAYTSKNLLFFQNFYKAVPLFANKRNKANSFISSSGTVFNMSVLEVEYKKACEKNYTFKQFNPFPLDKTHISWLKPDSTLDDIVENDKIALHEAERRANLIVNSSLVIDLRNVKEVNKILMKDVDLVVKKAGSNVWRHTEKIDSFDTTHLHKHHGLGYLEKLSDDEEEIDNCFEITLKGGATARFQVATRTIRDEWIQRLRELSKYWVLKHQEMISRLAKLSEFNDNEKGSFRSRGNEHFRKRVKWELAGAKTDTLLYSISAHALDNPVLMQGEIYKRRTDNRSFRKYFMVLSPGFLVVYNEMSRSRMKGTTKPSAYCKKCNTIALSNCYAFAGDLQGEHSYSSVVNINAIISGDYGDGLPALYDDGLRGNESMRDRVFSLWLGSKRLLIKNSKSKQGYRSNSKNLDRTTSESDEDYDSSAEDENSEFSEIERNGGNMDVKKRDDTLSKWEMMKYIGKLGARGKVITFLARSRIERDLWVTRIKGEIERFAKNKEDDIEIL